jgi:bifunctional ADP-heptose synthase (sugar kinase/adenylyltransferase)
MNASQHTLVTASKVANKSYLIAVGKLGTAIAFRPDLVGQLRFVD